MSTEKNMVQGECLCGAVRYEAALPIEMCGNCHCSQCRKANGAPYVSWALFQKENVKIISGVDGLISYRHSPKSTRQFCNICGSQIFFESAQSPDQIFITRATFDDEADVKPTAHIHFDSKAPWLAVDDDLPKLGGSTGFEPLD